MNDSLENSQESLRLREQLKRAVKSQDTPPYLEARIRNSLRACERRVSWTRRLTPVAVVLAVCLGAVVTYELGHLRLIRNSQESYIASVSTSIANLMRVGLGDHIHCSVFRKFSRNLPPVEELAGTMGQEHKDLIPIVRSHVPNNYVMAIAHECHYRGRRFVHLALKGDSKLLSLVIARKEQGESFAIGNILPALTQSGIPIYRAGAQPFEIASFETRDHLVYFVSDLPEKQNMEMMLAMAPEVKGFLSQKEL